MASILWTVSLCCLIGGTVAFTRDAIKSKFSKMKSTGFQSTGELWIPGRDAKPDVHDCLARTLSSRHKRLTGQPEDRKRVFEFLALNSSGDTTLTQGRFINGTIWFPSHIIHHAKSIHFVHCLKIKKKAGGKYKYEIKQDAYHRKTTSSGKRGLLARKNQDDRDNMDGRRFDVSSLFEIGDVTSSHETPEKWNIGHFFAIVHFSSAPLVSQIGHQHQDESSETDHFHSMHLTALPKPYLHLIYVESRKPHMNLNPNKKTALRTRLCDDAVNTTSNQPRQCCLRALDVNFAKIGWHWIAAPLTMRIHYCDGYCPHPFADGNMDTREASLLTLLQGNRPAVGQLCCVASSYRPHHVSVRLPGQTHVRLLDDLDAASCSCVS